MLEAHYTEPFNDNDYPWPGHNVNTSKWRDLISESAKIRQNFQRCNLTENDMFWHPAGCKQFETTQEAIDLADRVKVRMVLTNRYIRHYAPVFLPPGEICTVSLMPSAVGKVGVFFNKHMSGIWTLSNGAPKYSQRIDNMRLQFSLTKEVNTIGTPWGSIINFETSLPYPIEVNLSGVVLCPFFKYGLHSDSEWENELSILPGPVAILETGNIIINVPTKYVKSASRINDAMKWWRSAYQISQTTAKDLFNNWDPCVTNIVELNCECFIPCGGAVAFVGHNYAHFPQDWVAAHIRYDHATDNPWGNLHEMNHFHQNQWGPSGGADEISNNILNLITYAQQSPVSKYRHQSGWSRYSYASETLNSQGDLYAMYAQLIQHFGWERVRYVIRSDQANSNIKNAAGSTINRGTMGRRAAEYLRMCLVFNCDVKNHYLYYNNDETIFGTHADYIKICDEVVSLLPQFHPVCHYNMVGRIIKVKKDPYDHTSEEVTKGIYAAREPTIVVNNGRTTYEFNFAPVTRPDKEKFGDWEFKEIHTEPGRESAWVKKNPNNPTDAVYICTLKTNIVEMEEINVTYHDKKANLDTTIICQFSQVSKAVQGKRVNGESKLYIPPIVETYFMEGKDIYSAYSSAYRLKKNFVSFNHDALGTATHSSGHGFLTTTHGYFCVPETGDYEFSLATDDEALFYIHTSPLIANKQTSLDEFRPYLINHQKGACYDYSRANHSNPIHLLSNTSYCFLVVNLKHSGQGRCRVGYKVQNGWAHFPSDWLSTRPVIGDQITNAPVYHPVFQRMLYLDQWDGADFFRRDQSLWKVTDFPSKEQSTAKVPFSLVSDSKNREGTGRFLPNRDISNPNSVQSWLDEITKVLTDGDDTTEFRSNWWRGQSPRYDFTNGVVKKFEVDMGKVEEKIQFIKIGPSGNQGYYPMNSLTEIYISNEAIGESPNPDTLVWSGTYNSRNNYVIELPKLAAGRFMQIRFINNNLNWKDGNNPNVDISCIEIGQKVRGRKVLPMTHSTAVRYGSHWNEQRNGSYYNGKGFTSGVGGKVDICIPPNAHEISIVGDSYPEMGEADVYLDNDDTTPIGKIAHGFAPDVENVRLKYAHKSYKTILFYKAIEDPENKPHVFRIRVTKGFLALTGYVVDVPIEDKVLERDTIPLDFSQCPFAITKQEAENFTVNVPPPVDVNESSGFYAGVATQVEKEKSRPKSLPIILGVLIPVAVIGIAIVSVALYLYYHPEIMFNKRAKRDMQDKSLVNDSFVI